MPSATRHISPHPAVGELVVLSNDPRGSQAVVAPGRGAIVTSFRVGSRELLYLDEDTLADATKNVRGGIPLLFPFPGRLKDDTLCHGGERTTLPQHGFARTLPWRVVSDGGEDTAKVTLALESTPWTRERYPWDFEATYTLELSSDALRLTFTVCNRSADEMPIAFGVHPYFRVADKSRARVEAPVASGRDTFSGRDVLLASLDLTAPEVDVRFEPDPPRSCLHLGDGARVDIEASPEHGHFVIWTLAGRDFVCVEPWTERANALNEGTRSPPLPAGDTRTWNVKVSLGG